MYKNNLYKGIIMKNLKNTYFILFLLASLSFSAISLAMINKPSTPDVLQNSPIQEKSKMTNPSSLSKNSNDSDSRDEGTIAKKANVAKKIINSNNICSDEFKKLFKLRYFFKLYLNNSAILLEDKIMSLSNSLNIEENEKIINNLNNQLQYLQELKETPEIDAIASVMGRLITYLNFITVLQKNFDNKLTTKEPKTPIFYGMILNRDGLLSDDTEYDKNPGKIDIATAIKKKINANNKASTASKCYKVRLY